MKIRNKLIGVSLISAVTCALVGSITGTFAWYGYSTRVTGTLEGTAVGSGANLQIGIVAEDMDSLPGLEKDDNGIFWQPISGGLRSDAIKAYLDAQGYGSNSMRPITSGNLFDEKDEPLEDYNFKGFTLYQGIDEAADKADYFVLPIALRAKKVETEDYLKGENIYLSDLDIDVGTDEDTALANAFRVNFKETKADGFINTLVAPGKEDSGQIDLAGLLDLNKDGFADVVEKDYDHKERNERVYGAYVANSIVRSEDLTADYSVIPENYNYPAHLPLENHLSSKNVHVVTAFEACKQLYLGKNDVVAKFDSSLRLDQVNNNADAIATTSEDDGIAYLTISAWIEGWDLEEVDDHFFNQHFYLDMEFSIDRID